MSSRIPVFVYADDPISQAGVATQLRGRPETYVLDSDSRRCRVAIVVSNGIDDATIRVMGGIQRAAARRWCSSPATWTIAP